MQATRLFWEKTLQPTLPQSIRVMEREGEGGRSERPCGRTHLFDRIPQRGGRDGGRLRDGTEMTQHEAERVSTQEEEGFHRT